MSVEVAADVVNVLVCCYMAMSMRATWLTCMHVISV